MIKRKSLLIALAIICIVQTVIIVKPHLLFGKPVTSAESAIIIAKAALLRKYGEGEFLHKKFVAWGFAESEEKPVTWHVYENTEAFGNTLGELPHVRVSGRDGKVTIKWK